MKNTGIQVNKHLRRRKILKACQVYSLGIIPIFLLLVFNYIPMFGVIIAFKDYKYNKGILERVIPIEILVETLTASF